ncbi:hypothetical protein ACE6H2_008802 [Prunus campanulata]
MEDQLMVVSQSLSDLKEYAVLLTMEQNNIREQPREMSQFLSVMEEQLGILKSSREEPVSISEALEAPPPSDTDQRAETNSKGGEQQEEEDKLEGGDK